MSKVVPPQPEISPPSMGPRKVSAKQPAISTIDKAKLGEKALGLQGTLPCHEFLNSLISLKLRTDAIKFIAAWLPPRDSLWYGCLGVWQIARLQPQTAVREQIDKVVVYITCPSTQAWAEFGSFAAASKDSSPLGLLLQAAILTGDNICPFHRKNIKPSPAFQARTVANALVTAASKWPGKERETCLDLCINIGLDIAEGKHLWAPNPDQNYPGLRQATITGQMLGKTRNIWED